MSATRNSDAGSVREQKIAVTAAVSVAARLISIAVAFLSVPLVLHHLGPEKYGVWVTMLSIVAMLSFADFGVGAGLVNALAAAFAADDVVSIQRDISSGLCAVIVIAAILLSGLLAAWPIVDWGAIFRVGHGSAAASINLAILFFGISFCASIPVALIQRVQLSLQLGAQSAAWQIASSALLLGALVAVIMADGDLPALILTYLGVPILVGVANNIHFFAGRASRIRPRIRSVVPSRAIFFIQSGFWFLLIQLGNSVIAGALPLIISRVIGPSAVPDYSVPERLGNLVVMLVVIYVQPIWPAYREAAHRGDMGWVRQMYYKTSVRIGFVAGLLLLALSFVARPIMLIWVGPTIKTSALVVIGICIYKFVESFTWQNAMLMNGLEVLKFQAFTSAIGSMVFVSACYVSVSRYGIEYLPLTAACVLFFVNIVPTSLIIRHKFSNLLSHQLG